MIIKILLVAALGCAVLFAMRTQARGNHLAVRRIAAVGFMVAGALAVLLPETTTTVANWVGVGRGTDLLLYVLVVAFLFVTIGLHQRLHALERRFVDLARAMALMQAESESVEAQDARP